MSFLVDSSSMSSSLPSPADVASSLQPVLIDMLAAAVDAASVVPAVLIDAHAVGADAQLFLACARAVVAGLAGASHAARFPRRSAIISPCRVALYLTLFSHCSMMLYVDNSVITQMLEMTLGSDENSTLCLTYPAVS